ncbi:MAG: tRNA (adenosine(37)-N6)-threonylcarbamoyltransferase complex transferase subunit TsaD [Mucinivorans sp.]
MIILGIESSCDDTSAAVVRNEELLSNVIASQQVHEKWGGVVPELASRAHQQNIVPTVSAALAQAGLAPQDVDAVAFTRGPGLMGSLLVGVSFAKGFSLAVNKPMIEVNHLHGHILSHFLKLKDKEYNPPCFPFLCLLVSGGHTQIVLVKSAARMEIVGTTIDDAAGEAFDKCAKVMGLPYPGGPHVDRLASVGDCHRFKFARPDVGNLDFSFSGLKTSFLYTLRDQMALDDQFVANNQADLAASLQYTIIEILLSRLRKAVEQYGVKHVAIAGGVSANSGLRNAIVQLGAAQGWTVHVPERFLTTDNAAMIAITGYYKALRGEYTTADIAPKSRF